MGGFNQFLVGDASTVDSGFVRSGDIRDVMDVRLTREIESRISLFEQHRTPLVTALDTTASVPTSQPNFKTQQQYPFTNTTTVATAASASAVTIVVANADWIIPWMLMHNSRTGEQFRITSLSGTSLTVVREYSTGGNPAAAMIVGDTLIYSSPILYEGSDLPSMRWRGTDYEEFFAEKNAIAFGNTDLTEIRGYDGITEFMRQMEQQTREWKDMKERALLFNQPHSITSGDTDVFVSTGFRHECSRYNVVDLGGAGSLQAISEALSHIAKWGETDPLLAVSPELFGRLAFHPSFTGGVRTNRGDTQMGQRLESIMFPEGIGQIVPVRAMAYPNIKNEMLVISLETFRRRPLKPFHMLEQTLTTPFRREWMFADWEGVDCVAPIKNGLITNIGPS